MANFNYNEVLLGGRLTAAPELKATQNGTSVTSFTIAVNRGGKGKDGEAQVDFIDCRAWKESAEFITKYFGKGSSIFVKGELQKRQWTDKEGAKRYSTEVVVSRAYFVDSKGESGAAKQAAGETAGTGPAYIPDAYKRAPEFKDADDDDLPF